MKKFTNQDYYNFFTEQPKNIITSIEGDRGKGKTILQVYFLYKNPTLPKFVNYNLNLPNVKPLELDKILDFNYKERVMIGITESTTLLENQRAMTNLSLYLGYVAMQSRKIGESGLDIIIDEQILESIQNRFLTQCDIFITALGIGEKGFYYSLYLRKHKFFTNPILKYINFETLYKIKDLYDTKEKIEPMNIENLKVSAMSPIKLKERINILADKILSNKEEYGIKNKITYPQLNAILLEMEEPENLNYYLYGKINNVLNKEKNNEK